MNIEAHLNRREAIRFAAQDRAIDRLDRQMAAAEPLIGILCREGQTIYYVNQLDRSGRLTGKVIERTNRAAIIDYVTRNHYV